MKRKPAFRPRFTLVYYIYAIYVQALSISQRIHKKLTRRYEVPEAHTYTQKWQSHVLSKSGNMRTVVLNLKPNNKIKKIARNFPSETGTSVLLLSLTASCRKITSSWSFTSGCI